MSLHSVIDENPVWSKNNVKRVNNLSNLKLEKEIFGKM